MTKLIVSLDVESLSQTFKFIDLLSPKVEFFKVGMVPFVNFGDELLRKLQFLGKKVFLDLKFHDIPNTVKSAVRSAAKKGVYMMNIHCLGGLRMLQFAVEGVNEAAMPERPLLLGVTILTSMVDEEIKNVGLSGSVREMVTTFAMQAKEAGLDGVVVSAKEARMIREKMGEDFIIVTPGIRPEWSFASKGDQRRVLTPRQAAMEGADYIVVGRSILRAENPLEATNKIMSELFC